MVALLPKKDNTTRINDLFLKKTRINYFRPISLIHSMAKLVAKVVSIRLSKIISPAHSAFLKIKSIHDSFLYVQNCVRSLHRKKKPALLIKHDIARAFDCVS